MQKIIKAIQDAVTFLAGKGLVKAILPDCMRAWSRRFRIKMWLRTGYREHLISEAKGGRKLLHFLHISKTGGTAIKSAIQNRQRTRHYFTLVTPHPVQLGDIPKGEKVAFVLRDPLSRFVSGFFSRLREGRPAYYVPWTRSEKCAFELFPSPNSLGLGLVSSNLKLRRKAKKAMRCIGHINTKFSFWLKSIEYLKSREADLLFVGFQENLTEDFERFKTSVGYDEEVELPNDKVKAHRAESSSTKLDPEAERALREWYAEDYALYEYCKSLSD